MRLYVASSWRNPRYEPTLAALRAAGFDCYDFKEPTPGGRGFHWSEVGGEEWRDADAAKFRDMLAHPISVSGFKNDMDALAGAFAVVLVLPCGRSAHLELGYAVGAGKPTVVILDERNEPELMYRMVSRVALDVDEAIAFLRSAEVVAA